MKKSIIHCLGILGFILALTLLAPVAARAQACAPTIAGGPFATIQAAIDAAVPGNTINVAGVCNETVVVNKAVTLSGGGGPLGVPGGATINGGGSGNATVLVTAIGATIVGFNITGGQSGIQVSDGAAAEIDSNVISGVGGNGVLIHRASVARVINNLIENNPNGSGVTVTDSSHGRIGFTGPAGARVAQPNTIQNNGTADNSSAITVVRSSSARILSNTISGNGRHGIRVGRASHADISSNIINGNGVGTLGGDGVSVGENSGVNLGSDTVDDPVEDSHNTTTVNNVGFGIDCSINSSANGVLGTPGGVTNGLNGNAGQTDFGSGCVNSLIADHIIP